jgi:transposase
MYFTGIDLHKKTCFITTIDEGGRVICRANLRNDPQVILDYFAALDQKTRIVIESCASWYWLYDLLTDNGYKMIVSNPVKTKAIASARIKNDKLDSHMLAQLLRANLVATVHVSSIETRKLKELVRHRQKLVRDASRMKNRIHSILAKNNSPTPFSDLFGVKGLQYLEEIQLPDYHRFQVDNLLSLYQHLQERIEPLTEAVNKLAKEHPMAKLLVTIPGIGPITAMFIVAEIEDIGRFPSYRDLASYAGLVPSLNASGANTHTGRITKQGSVYLRTALVEAAQAIPRMKHCRLNLFFRRRIVKSGYGKAIVATAHKILQYVYFVLRNQTPYLETYPIVA